MFTTSLSIYTHTPTHTSVYKLTARRVSFTGKTDTPDTLAAAHTVVVREHTECIQNHMAEPPYHSYNVFNSQSLLPCSYHRSRERDPSVVTVDTGIQPWFCIRYAL